jgi:hypothetical protein
VSFLSNLFNRKERSENPVETKESSNFHKTEDEYLEDEELEDTSEEDGLKDIMEDEDGTLAGEKETDVEYEVVEREILPTKIICPDCGGITLEGLDFCDKCGGEL